MFDHTSFHVAIACGTIRPVSCLHCAIEPLSAEAQFCRKCGATLTSRPRKVAYAIRLLVLPIAFVGRAPWYPVRLRQERIRWLTEGEWARLSDQRHWQPQRRAKRVYSYLASVTLRFGSSHSKVTTIARVTHLSENHARAAIRELERRGLLSHQRRNTWHGRGAHAYYVRPVSRKS